MRQSQPPSTPRPPHLSPSRRLPYAPTVFIQPLPTSLLPARLLHPWDPSRQRIHAETILSYPSVSQSFSHNPSENPIFSLQIIHPTHPCHAKIPENPSSLPPHDTPIPDLRGPGVAMHLAELELRLCPRALRQGCVADEVAEGLSICT